MHANQQLARTHKSMNSHIAFGQKRSPEKYTNEQACPSFFLIRWLSLEGKPAQFVEKKEPEMGPPGFEPESPAPQAGRMPSYPTGPKMWGL